MPPACTHVLDSGLFNKCLRDASEGFGWMLGNWTEEIIHHPTIFTQFFVLLVVVMPFLMVDGVTVTLVRVVKRFQLLRFKILNFIHRMGYVFVLGDALKTMFRQLRPCNCGGRMLGDMYGMPSQDAMMAGLVGMWLITDPPFWRWRTRVIAVLFMVTVAFQRNIVGMHTLGQVLAGTALGIFIHLITVRLPQFFVLLEDVVQVTLALTFAFLDPSLKGAHEDYIGFTFVGISFMAFADLLLWQHHEGSWTSLKQSYHTVVVELEEGSAYEEIPSQDMTADEKGHDYEKVALNTHHWLRTTDFTASVAAFSVHIGILFLGKIISHYKLFGIA